MNGFVEYLESKKIEDTDNLIIYITDFLKDPSIFFDLNAAERNELDKKLDEVLAVFKTKQPHDTK